ncbi:KdsC family phosphatase [Marinoscillum sp.]|uniref:KdsC family phosphatase n=1 Tax=Marinoscillum sp. TaxID=2024838 RepID=UPI003BA966EA
MTKEKADKIKMLILDVDGTLTDGGVYVMEDGKQFKKFNAKDGMGIRLAMKAGVEVGIISHSMVSEMVTSRANALKMKYYYVGEQPKLEVLDRWLEELNLSYEQIAFIGDDVNDLEIMQKVGFSACPSDSVKAIKEIATVTLSQKGGDGAVREFIEDYILPLHT